MRWRVALLGTMLACGGAESTPAAKSGEPAQLVIPPMDGGAAPLVIVDASTPPPAAPEEPNHVDATDARDPRANTPPRGASAIAAELHALEGRLKTMASSSPGRADVLMNLANGNAELARSHDHRTADGQLALQRSITHLATLIQDFPSDARLDEARYYRGLAYEQLGQLAPARREYYELIKNHPASRHLGCAYYAFGEMFFVEAHNDPSKWDLAKQAFKEAMKYPPAKSSCHALARDRLSEIPNRP